MKTELQTLFNEINKFSRYPQGIERISGNMPGNIFFPGGPGIYNHEDGKISNRKIMVVGPMFDINLNFNKLHGARDQKIRISPGFSNLLLLLIKGGIDPLDCFFTNVIPGVRKPGVQKRKSSAFWKRYFMDYCRMLFRMELEIQRPKLMLVLGIKTAGFLSSFHPKLIEWSNLRTIKQADEQYYSVMENVPFTLNSSTTLVLLVHPVGRHANIGPRHFGKYRGDNAEVRMLSSVNHNL